MGAQRNASGTFMDAVTVTTDENQTCLLTTDLSDNHLL